jgi:hypothetical protein
MIVARLIAVGSRSRAVPRRRLAEPGPRCNEIRGPDRRAGCTVQRERHGHLIWYLCARKKNLIWYVLDRLSIVTVNDQEALGWMLSRRVFF